MNATRVSPKQRQIRTCAWRNKTRYEMVYEMENNCSLFDRLFKKNNDIFLFGISFFVLEILTFFYYANYESDDVTRCGTKIAKYWINNIPGNIEAVFFKLSTRIVYYVVFTVVSSQLADAIFDWVGFLERKNFVI